MWLENHMDAVKSALPGCRECGAYFSGMVAVVVDDCYTLRHSNHLETAIDSVEARERLAHSFQRYVESYPYSNRGGRVAEVVCARDAELKSTEVGATIAYAEAAYYAVELTPAALQLCNTKVGAFALTIGKRSSLYAGKEAA